MTLEIKKKLKRLSEERKAITTKGYDYFTGRFNSKDVENRMELIEERIDMIIEKFGKEAEDYYLLHC